MLPVTTVSSSSIKSKQRTNRLAVFYHLFQGDGWEKLHDEQSALLISSELTSYVDFVHVGVSGDKIPAKPHSSFVYERNELPWFSEASTLKKLKSFCLQNPDYKVLYMHTKGISVPTPQTKDWRSLMEYFCIEQWERCIEELESHDAVGCLYTDHCWFGFFPHFSGNFWWANAEYIGTLDHSFLDSGSRHHCEFWIGTGSGSMKSLHDSGANHYAVDYPRSLYAN